MLLNYFVIIISDSGMLFCPPSSLYKHAIYIQLRTHLLAYNNILLTINNQIDKSINRNFNSLQLVGSVHSD